MKHGGNIYKIARDHGVEKVLDFSANINPLGLSHKGMEGLLEHIDEILHYPDPEHRSLLGAMSAFYDMPEDYIYLGNGAAELIYALGRLSDLGAVTVPAPAFSEYRESAIASGVTCLSYPLEMKRQNDGSWRFAYNYDRLNEAAMEILVKSVTQGESIQNHMSIVYVGNPNNPDGSLVDPEALEELIDRWKGEPILWAIDESFMEFTDGRCSMRPAVLKYNNVAVVHSLTKFYGIPGLRLGAMFCQHRYGDRVAKSIPTWSVNRLAQCYGEAALQDKAYQEASRKFIVEEGELFFKDLLSIEHLHPCRPSVNYILVEIDGTAACTAGQLAESMLAKGIMIRNCEAYEALGPRWFRLAVRDRESNKLCVKALRECLA